MKLDPNQHFLVLNKAACEVYRQQVPGMRYAPLAALRKVLLPALMAAEVVSSREEKRWGLVCQVNGCLDRCGGLPFDATLVYGDLDNPKWSPDGRLRVVHLAHFQLRAVRAMRHAGRPGP